jgi:hypothetical protein
VATTLPHSPTRNHAATLSITVAPIVGHVTHPIPVPRDSHAEFGGICLPSQSRPLGSAGIWAAWLLALIALGTVIGPVLPAALGVLGLRPGQRPRHSVPALTLARHAMTMNERTRTQPRPTGVGSTDVAARAPCHTHENGATDGITNDNVVLTNGTWCVSLVKCNVPTVAA